MVKRKAKPAAPSGLTEAQATAAGVGAGVSGSLLGAFVGAGLAANRAAPKKCMRCGHESPGGAGACEHCGAPFPA